MKYLFVVDLQKEFVKDPIGLVKYNNCLEFIENHRFDYDVILATVYYNDGNVNMLNKVEWTKMQDELKPLEFTPDMQLFHSGYAPLEYPFQEGDTADVIGFDTDACVLNECFDLFNRNIDFRILIDGCWSSGGAKMHRVGLKCMKRQFNKALDFKTKVR